MSFRKVVSSIAASAVAVSALAVSAGAALVVPDSANPANESSVGTGQVMIKLYVDGAVEKACDIMAIDSIKVRISPAESDRDFFEGQTGGAITVSCGPASVCPEDHNWIMSDYWGITDEALGLENADPERGVVFEKVGDYLYEGTCKITDANCIYPEVLENEGGYVQIAFQEWGNDMADIEVISVVCLDKSGNTLIAYDGAGYVTSGGAAAPAAAATAPAADNAAPAAGNVAAATDSSKGSPDTGIADVAAVAGLAIVAAGALVISKKRK